MDFSSDVNGFWRVKVTYEVDDCTAEDLVEVGVTGQQDLRDILARMVSGSE